MKIHIVQEGETLTSLANKYEIDYDLLIVANPQIASPDMVMPGMKIKIPSDSYKVKTEQQPSKITKRNHKAIGQKVNESIRPMVTREKQKEALNDPKSVESKSKVRKKEQKNNPQSMSTLEGEVSYHAFTPHKRMETEMQMDMQRQRKQPKEIVHSPLHKGQELKEEKIPYCFICHQPMEMERPLYFPMNSTTKENKHRYPYLPANLSEAKPNDYLS